MLTLRFLEGRLRPWSRSERSERRAIFRRILRQNEWGDRESVSGPGSSLARTETIRREIPRLLKEIDARSLLDAPCGDFNWMRAAQLDLDRYIGVDIVPELIDRNRRLYGSRQRRFLCADLAVQPLPRVDVIFCRDCLVHLTLQDIHRVLANFRRSRPRYLLTTTFLGPHPNAEIETGSWRPLNLQLPPFNLPAPLALIDEYCPAHNGRYADKHLALWRLADFQLFP
jgi:hypothetical protein